MVSSSRVIIAAVLMLASVRSSAAQSDMDVRDVLAALTPGTTVTIEAGGGARTTGKIVEIRPAAVILDGRGSLPQQSTFTFDRIISVRRTDSRVDGFVAGMIGGLLPGLLIGNGLYQYCQNEASHCVRTSVTFASISTLLGGWVGWEIDGAAARGPLVFARGPVVSSLRVTPIVDVAQHRVRLSVGF